MLIRNEDISSVNRVLYVLALVATVVVYLDVFAWRPL